MSTPTYETLITVPVSDLADLLIPMLEERLVPFILGAPGIGKTETVETTINNDERWRFIDCRMSEMEPADLLGYPSPDHESGVMRFLPSEMLPRTGPPIALFCDEYNQASMEMMRASLRLFRNPETYLPAGSVVLGAGNMAKHKSGVNSMFSPVASRCSFIKAVPTLDGWLQWAMTHGVHPVAMAYARFQPSVITGVDQHEFKMGEEAFACSRSLTEASKVFHKVPAKNRTSVLVGKLGVEHGLQFDAFLACVESMVAPEDILRDPRNAPVPTELQKIWAVSGGLCDYMISRMERSGNVMERGINDLFGRFLEYAARFPREFEITMVSTVTSACAELTKTPSWRDFNKKNPGFLNAA